MADASVPNSFHLQWNNHLSNLQTLLEYLYNEQSFVDVTLSCSDGLIRAHKLVLSACSPYFETIFRENPCKHPTVILKGITLRKMQLIIEYMYVGSVDIPEHELSAMLEIANELHVKGLMQDAGDEEKVGTNKPNEPSNTPSEQMVREEKAFENSIQTAAKEGTERKHIDNADSSDSNRANEEAVPIVPDGLLVAQIKVEEEQVPMNYEPSADASYEQSSNAVVFRYQYNGESNSCSQSDLFCRICKRGFLNKHNMKRHMQTHMGVKPHQCNFCSLSFLRLSHLQRHHRVHTGERPFQCNHCDKQFARSDKLKQHISLHHLGFVVPKQLKPARGRPRKVRESTSLNLASPNQKLPNEDVDMDNTNCVPSYQTLQQIYNIPNAMSGMSVVQ